MPSKSKAQHNLMEAVTHSPEFSESAGIPQSVGRDFASADKSSGKFGTHKSAKFGSVSKKSRTYTGP